MKSGSDPIPKKQKKSGGKYEKPQGHSLENRLCQLCAEYSPEVKNKHNTTNCRKWHAYGAPKGRDKRKQVTKNANAHAKAGNDYADTFAQMRKEIKSLRKLTKRKQKKRSKRKYESSSDDSSDSNSE
jgi:hypothetical protein